MQHSSAAVNPVEKQRLRDAIRQDVNRYLARGGAITVVDGPGDSATDHRARARTEGDAVDEWLD